MRFLLRIIIFVILIFIVEFYFSRKTISSIKSVFIGTTHLNIKRFTTAFFIFINLYPVFLIIDWSYASITNTNVWVPQNFFFDYFIIYPFWLFILISVQSGLFYLLIDFLRIILFPFYRKYKHAIQTFQHKLTLIIFSIFIVYVPVRIIYDHNIIDVRTVIYHKKDLPQSLNNFKIVFVSDMQADRYTGPRRLNKLVSDINTENPDLVLMGGDMITSTPDYIDEAARYAGKIKSKYGVYSCVGDHDNWAYHNNYAKSLNEVTTALKKYNVLMLNDTNMVLKVHTNKIKITFTTNTYMGRNSGNLLDSLTTDSVKYDLKILLTHQPRNNVIKRGVEENYDLILAGHTHGGQVTFLFPMINLTPTLLETKFVRGNFIFGNTLLIVTRGLGMSLVPLRYNSTPEVTVINIVK